ncbi:recombinase XerD [Fischerella thermalis CCMEE 5198]|jgi:integrase|uniref:tyrosine-type recombinase/integrase n=1 Tax=Fischerella thermalis TaxID=372787 RepID=UPI000C7FDFEB|nr:site-specific integrase [Fischerella thermalis]PMB24336.1 recombinase XerD [Fischerella thermalis CCMEE 5198]
MNKVSNKSSKNNAPNLKIVEIGIDDKVVCRFCGSNNYTTAGKRYYKKDGISKIQQRYQCKSCGRKFILGSQRIDIHTLEMPRNFTFDNDVWLASHIGLRVSLHLDPHQKDRRIIFSDISQNFLKLNVKRFILYKSSTTEFTTINQDYMTTFRSFSDFLSDIRFYGQMEDINRKIIVDYANYLNQKRLSPKTRYRRLSVLSLFFETGIINDWFQIPSCLVRKEDYPKQVRPLPRYIPEEVMKQLNQHLDALPEPVMRMTLVVQECGLRIGELCQLTLDCLKHDGKGQWRIQFMRWKTKTEDSIPISKELAKVIQEQQHYIQENFSSNFKYLFCGRRATSEFIPEPKVITGNSFIKHLKKIAEDYEIKDKSGKIWDFQTHQFRHTVGTRMINAGVPQHIVQRYLGHESPAMTQVYAHIHDKTLRKEIEKYHESRVVNFQGETAEIDETILSSNDDLEWFKKNVQARALEHGYCARPKVLGDCDIPGFDGCYNCPHWRTNKNFLPILKDTLERTNNVLEKARNCGWQLQVNKNTPIKDNLEKVIKTLEADND